MGRRNAVTNSTTGPKLYFSNNTSVEQVLNGFSIRVVSGFVIVEEKVRHIYRSSGKGGMVFVVIGAGRCDSSIN